MIKFLINSSYFQISLRKIKIQITNQILTLNLIEKKV